MAGRKKQGNGAAGNPPASTRFQPGQSGNPGGRPRRERDLAKLADAALDKPGAKVEIDGKIITLTRRETMIENLVTKAAKAEFPAIDRLLRILERSSAAEDPFAKLPPDVLASFARRFAPPEGAEK
jgi:hypothetical protein